MTRTCLTLIAVLLVACGGNDKPAPGSSAGSDKAPVAAASLPANLQLADAPKEPMDVQDAKSKTKDGQEVVVRGRIGGDAVKTFIAGRASMLLADADGIVPCNLRPGDKCTQPWDYCCDSKEDIQACTIPVQVVGSDGKVIKKDLKGWKGLRELSIVVVTGKIKMVAKTPILIATGIYIESAEPEELKDKHGKDSEDG